MPKACPAGVIFTDLDGTLLDHHTYDFSPARSALEAARAAGLLIVLCSSKTRAELRVSQVRLGILGPFVAENGGGVFLTGGGPLEPLFDGYFDGVPGRSFGTPYARVRSAFCELRRRLDLPIRGFGDMEPAELGALTGLRLCEAVLAGRRDYDEPFLWEREPRDEELARLLPLLREAGLRVVRGGRLWHLTGPGDKGVAVRWLLEGMKVTWNRALPSMALGDAENDLPMLEAVDRGVLVRRADGTHWSPRPAATTLADGVGPEGWAEAVKAWIADKEKTDV